MPNPLLGFGPMGPYEACATQFMPLVGNHFPLAGGLGMGLPFLIPTQLID